MNRMIKLFQQRSDQAYEKYLLNRAKVVEGKLPIDSHEWDDAVVEGAKLFEQYRIWAKAAELLRKEELNK